MGCNAKGKGSIWISDNYIQAMASIRLGRKIARKYHGPYRGLVMTASGDLIQSLLPVLLGIFGFTVEHLIELSVTVIFRELVPTFNEIVFRFLKPAGPVFKVELCLGVVHLGYPVHER